MNENSKKQFFALVKSGLWNVPIDESLFTDVDWKAILSICDEQTLNGILFEGISMLPTDRQPSTALMRQLYQRVICIEQTHTLLNQRLKDAIKILQSESITPILLKGQGVALNYLEPIRRQCGDIDLYVGKKDYDRAYSIFLALGLEAEDDGECASKHYHFEWKGVTIELHKIADNLPMHNRKFQKWTHKHLKGDSLRKVNIGGGDVLLPPFNFDAFYIFLHLFSHLMLGGIGLRQLCDWARYLHVNKNQINQDELLHDLKSLGLYHAWQVFGCIVVNELGLPQGDFPFYTTRYKQDATIVLKNIFQMGNFGQNDPTRSKGSGGYISQKWHSLMHHQKQMGRLFSVFPIEISEYGIYYLLARSYRAINTIAKR